MANKHKIIRCILNIIIIFQAFSFISKSFAQVSVDFSKISLVNMHDNDFILRDSLNKYLNVFVFISPECPACIRYTSRLNEISEKYQSNYVNVIGIIPGNTFPKNEINSYKSALANLIRIYVDKDYSFTHALKATTTPQAFIIDSIGNILYSGMIDNWYYKLGKVRKQTTDYYLKENIDSYLSGNKILHQSNNPIGCYIF
jgi:thiol-disulfide isomerase/thioredoxin